VGALHAQRLRWAARDHLDDPLALALRFDELTEVDVAPWVHVQMAADRDRLAVMDAARDGREPPPLDPEDAALFAAIPFDADAFRALMETVGCLTLPAEAFARPAVRAAVAAHAGEAPMPFPGPSRDDLVRLLA
jgi:hypothetical protein